MIDNKHKIKSDDCVILGMERGSHKEYIEDFCGQFHDSIIVLIDRAVEESQKLFSDPVYSETLQHLHACHNYCEVFEVLTTKNLQNLI